MVNRRRSCRIFSETGDTARPLRADVQKSLTCFAYLAIILHTLPRKAIGYAPSRRLDITALANYFES
jgi:hypothetical protein